MESGEDKVKWLQEVLDASQGPEPKRVKFSDIHESLCQRFGENISTIKASQLMTQAYPRCEPKRMGQTKHKYYMGLTWKASTAHPMASAIQQLPSPSLQPLQPCSLSSFQLQARNEELEHTVAQLREKVAMLEQKLGVPNIQIAQLQQEADALLSEENQVIHGPDTVEHLSTFSLQSVRHEMQLIAPNLDKLLHELADTSRNFQRETKVEEIKAVVSACVLLNARSRQANGLQLWLGFMLVARGITKQAIAALNHAGVCASYTTVWDYLRRLTQEANYLEEVQSGHWMWVYDNLNIHQRVRHERFDHHSQMMNLTSRLAVNIRYVPLDGLDWNDNSPQRPRSSLTLDDVLLSERDGDILHNRAVEYVMNFLVTHLSKLAPLAKFAPADSSPHPVIKSRVVPMKILFKDEKYIDETVDILSQLAEDACLTSSPQVVVGDQLTCKNIRGAKQARRPELEDIDRMFWAHENPGDFHFLWECLKVIYLTFWGKAGQEGSISNLRELVHRLQVSHDAKVFSISDEFLVHCFSSHLLADICQQLGMKGPDDPIQHVVSEEWLRLTADRIVRNTILPSDSKDPVYAFHRAFLRASYHYIDLRNAIRMENGEHVIRMWRFWLVYFLGSGRKNYAREAANLICNIEADLPKGIAYVTVHNRTVNMTGKQGHGKPVDQLIEHYNLVIKQALQTSGSNATHKHVEEVSLSALFLMDAAKGVDAELGVHKQSTRHTTREVKADTSRMVTSLLDSGVCTERSSRYTTLTYKGPEAKGNEKVGSGWVESYILETEESDEAVEETSHDDEVNLEYELYDT